MATIFDYLNWRGDLSLQQIPLNPVDALILSRISFLPFEGIVSGQPGQNIVLGQAIAALSAHDNLPELLHMRRDIEFMEALLKSERFSDLRLSAYVNEVDNEVEKQFAAVTIDLGDGSYFISFRGTDNTLVGWKEDFNMTFMTPVPAQRDAVAYVEHVAKALSGHLLLGGHSKGGNLAVYAAAFCSPKTRRRITRVYNNDGPGFDAGVISQLGYGEVRRRISTFVPQTSIVGMLLEHEEEYTIVGSDQRGLLQHDLFSWQVGRDNFICFDTVSNSSRFIDRTLRDWMAAIEPAQREQWIDGIYSIFSQTGVGTLQELTRNWHKNALLVLKSLTNTDENFRHFTSRALLLLLHAARQNLLMLKPAEALPLHRRQRYK